MTVRTIMTLTGAAITAVGLSPASAQTAAGTPAAEAAPAQASPAEANSADGIADIVVTAQRRAQSLQKTALTIEVLQPDALRNAGVTSATALTSVLPGVQIGTTGPSPSVYIRGVGAYSSTAAQSPAVPFYVDGVYLARSQGLPTEFYDVDRVEVLKGPQGTLYGRNASGGAINILTRAPELGVVNGHAELEIGNYGNQNGEAAINVPIGETVAARASFQISDKSGYTSENLSDDKHQSGRLKLLWKPDSDISLLLNGSYGHIGGSGTGTVLLNRIPGWRPWLDSSSPEARALTLGIPLNGPANPAIGQFGPGAATAATPDQAIQRLNFWNISGEFNWNFGATTLTIVPGYRDSRMKYATPLTYLISHGLGFDYAGSNGTRPPRAETSQQTSVEARLSGNGDVLKWVAGLYYYNEDQFEQLVAASGALSDTGSEVSYGTRSYAAFGQATLKVADRLRLIGGLRYTSDRRSIKDGTTYFVRPSILAPGNACFVPIVIQGVGECASDRYAGTKTFHNISWKAGFEADASDDILVYATASRGFKAGGFNTQSIPSDPGSGTRVGTALLFRPETLTSYEGGFKGRFLDNKLQLNVQGFYWDYKNHQEPRIALTPTGNLNLIYLNAGVARIYGADVELVARPWRGGTIDLSGEYANSKYSSFVFNVPTAAFRPTSTGCASAAQSDGTTRVDCSGFEVAGRRGGAVPPASPSSSN